MLGPGSQPLGVLGPLSFLVVGFPSRLLWITLALGVLTLMQLQGFRKLELSLGCSR